MIEKGRDFDIARKNLCCARQDLPQIGNDIQRRNTGVFEDGQQHAALPVLSDDIGLRGKTVAHLCDVPNVNDGAADTFDRQVVQQTNSRRVNIEINRHFFSADLSYTARIGERAAGDSADHI